MKKLLGVLLLAALLGTLGYLVYLDLSEHGITELTHYIVHILVCIMFCTLLHNPAHRFIKWITKLLGFNSDDKGCH